MTISCLTITQLSRIDLLQRSLSSFSQQTIETASRELLIVHHDGHQGTAAIQTLLIEFGIEARIIEASGAPLGTLRNISIRHAAGDLLCQWDDDDIYHPDRLIMQSTPFLKDDCIATTLDSQIVWFRSSGELYVRRGRPEGIHGTIMFRNGLGLDYDPSMPKGEDSRLIEELLLLHPSGICRIDDRPELYVRTYHGRNTWDLGQHRRQIRRAFSVEWLKLNEGKIRTWIETLRIPTVRVRDVDEVAFIVETQW